MEQTLFEKLTGLQQVKKFAAFYGTRRFITAVTSARHLSLSRASTIQFTTPTSQLYICHSSYKCKIFVRTRNRIRATKQNSTQSKNQSDTGIWLQVNEMYTKNRVFCFALFPFYFFNYSRTKICIIDDAFSGHSVVTKCMNWIHPEQGAVLRVTLR